MGMRVALGIPWFDGGCEYRQRAYSFIQRYLPTLYPFDHLLVSSATNRGAARNELVDQATARSCDVVVLCDADSYPDAVGLRTAVESCYTGGGIHFPFDHKSYRGLSAGASALLLEGQYQPEDAHSLPAEGTTIGSFGGCFAVRPSSWWSAAGSPEFPAWGYEDIVTVCQFRSLLSEDTVWHTDTALTHLWHPRAIETDNLIHILQRAEQLNICKEFELAQYDQQATASLIIKYKEYYREPASGLRRM